VSSEEHLRLALRRFAPLILLCTLLGAGALVGVSELEGPQYQATSQVIVENPGLDAGFTENSAAGGESQTVGATAALLAASPGFFQFAAREMREPNWRALQHQVEVSQAGSTGLISFAVTAGSAGRAVTLAGRLAHAFPLYRATVEVTPIQQALAAARREAATAPHSQQLGASVARLRLLEAVTIGGLQIGNAAFATRVRPAVSRSGLEGAMLGLVVGLLLMAALEAFDTRVRSRVEIEGMLGLRTLGWVPAQPGPGSAPNTSAEREARRLSAAMDDFRAVGQGTVVALVGASEESGLLGASAFLAEALRMREERVCVIDGGASLYERAAAAAGAGNGSALEMPSAPHAHRPLPAPVVEDLRLRFDWILIDSPPALSSARASRLAGVADSVVLVASLGKITRAELERVRREIASWPCAPGGTILLGKRPR
jgi:capsular polysaccharide biosynthesis protein